MELTMKKSTNMKICTHKMLYATLWILLLGFHTDLYAQSGFGDPTTLVQGVTRDFVFADIDGDGNLDIVSIANGFFWFKNNGDGTFGSANRINSPGDGRNYQAVAAGDLNGNGNIDVVAIAPSFTTIIYYVNNGGGNFEEEETEILNGGISGNLNGMFTGDLNNNGNIDVGYTVFTGGTLGFFENDGSGEFGDQVLITGGNVGDNGSNMIQIVDLNLDGKPDLVSASSSYNKLAVYMNAGDTGSASFPTENVINSDKNFSLVHATDLYGDQFPELMYGAGSEIGFYPNQQTGNFVPGSEFIITNEANGVNNIISGDLTGNGANDIVYASFSRNEIVWMENEGGFNNPFQTARVISNTAFAITKIMLQDMNNNGRLDVVALLRDGEGGFPNQIVWFENMTHTVVSTEREETPKAFILHQNYPNPFNPATNIGFQLSEASEVSLKVYDMLGREVAALLTNSRMSSGAHTIAFNAENLSSGIYMYRLNTGGVSETKTMSLIK
jgi:hypothetical protein